MPSVSRSAAVVLGTPWRWRQTDGTWWEVLCGFGLKVELWKGDGQPWGIIIVSWTLHNKIKGADFSCVVRVNFPWRFDIPIPFGFRWFMQLISGDNFCGSICGPCYRLPGGQIKVTMILSHARWCLGPLQPAGTYSKPRFKDPWVTCLTHYKRLLRIAYTTWFVIFLVVSYWGIITSGRNTV